MNGGSNPGFALLRVGYSARHGKGGLYTDGQFLANVQGCEKYGVPMGVYFYCYDKSAAAARLTAQQVVKMLAGHKWDYLIYYDVEYEPFNKSCGKATNTAIIQAALEVLEAAGYYAAVYCSRDFSSTTPTCPRCLVLISGKPPTRPPTPQQYRTACGSTAAKMR